MNPSIPNVPENLKSGAVDLDKVREDLAKEKAERQAKEERAMMEAVYAWNKAMNRTFKGISGASSLHRRFRQRATAKRLQRGQDA
jgi:hypothetical protein